MNTLAIMHLLHLAFFISAGSTPGSSVAACPLQIPPAVRLSRQRLLAGNRPLCLAGIATRSGVVELLLVR